jgi:hypothetical protein
LRFGRHHLVLFSKTNPIQSHSAARSPFQHRPAPAPDKSSAATIPLTSNLSVAIPQYFSVSHSQSPVPSADFQNT